MIILPSRGRPDSLREFFEVSQPRERGVVMLDADDAKNYEGVTLPLNWNVLIGPRIGCAALFNVAFNLYPDEPWYGYGSDDLRCRPVGWDERLASVCGSKEIAYGDDLINGGSLCSFPFIGGDLVRKAGWLSHPNLQHLYCDTVWRDIGKALGVLRYCPEIVTEHLHWSTGKQPYDLTAQERKTQGDREAYEEFMRTDLRVMVQRCKEVSCGL